MKAIEKEAKDRGLWFWGLVENAVGEDELGWGPLFVQKFTSQGARRPRLYSNSVEPGGHLEIEVLVREIDGDQVFSKAWTGGWGLLKPGLDVEGWRNAKFPTFTRAIPCRKLPPSCAGLDGCSEEVKTRWVMDIVANRTPIRTSSWWKWCRSEEVCLGQRAWDPDWGSPRPCAVAAEERSWPRWWRGCPTGGGRWMLCLGKFISHKGSGMSGGPDSLDAGEESFERARKNSGAPCWETQRRFDVSIFEDKGNWEGADWWRFRECVKSPDIEGKWKDWRVAAKRTSGEGVWNRSPWPGHLPERLPPGDDPSCQMAMGSIFMPTRS